MEGQVAPEWELEMLDGAKAPTLASLRGRIVLVLIINRGCPGCIGRAVPYAKALKGEFPWLEIITVHSQTEGRDYSDRQIEEIALLHKLPFPIYKDKALHTYELMKAEGTPHWILIDKEGIVVNSIFGSMSNAQQRLAYALEEINDED